MPKRLENVRGRLIEIARDLLLNEGYDRLTLREAASRCHIAVGTIYNYFPSREMLIAEVLLGDWLETMEAMKLKALQSENVLDSLECLYEGIHGFSCRYQPTWSNYKSLTCSVEFLNSQHTRLVHQVEETIRQILEIRLKEEYEKPESKDYYQELPHFLAQTILSGAVSGEPFTKKKKIYERLLV